MWTERSDYRTVSEVKGQRSAAGQHTQNISACERHSCSSTPPPPAPTLSSLSRGVKGGRTAAHRPVFLVTWHQTAFTPPYGDQTCTHAGSLCRLQLLYSS